MFIHKGPDKPCAQCKRMLPKSQFYRSHGVCKDCYNRAQREWNNSPEGKEYQRLATAKYNRSEKGKVKREAWNNSPRGKEISIAHNTKKRGATVIKFTPADWVNALNRFQNSCAYCGIASIRLTRDHIVPVAKGGQHVPENIVPACFTCNRRKGNRTPEEWGVAIRQVAA